MATAPASAVADAVEMLAGPPLLHMVHSHQGATVACQVMATATAKQRKKVIKAMKGKALRRASPHPSYSTKPHYATGCNVLHYSMVGGGQA